MKKSTKTDWQKLSNQNEKEIDYNDIPKTDEIFWKNSEVILPHKKLISLSKLMKIWLYG